MNGFKPKNLLTRRFWEPITRSLFLIATGAYLLIMYLMFRLSQPEHFEPVLDQIQLAWFALLIVWGATTPRQKQTIEDPGPAFSGAAVVLACGFGASIFLIRGASWPNGFILPGAIMLATIVVAILVYRFASKHAQNIGEARFYAVTSSVE